MCTCERALELISLGLDGEWKEEERQELEEHLAHCSGTVGRWPGSWRRPTSCSPSWRKRRYRRAFGPR